MKILFSVIGFISSDQGKVSFHHLNQTGLREDDYPRGLLAATEALEVQMLVF